MNFGSLSDPMAREDIPTDTPVYRAREAAGGLKQLAEIIDRTERQTIKYQHTGKFPAEICVKVHEALGIPLHELRPDIFPTPANEPKRKRGKAAA